MKKYHIYFIATIFILQTMSCTDPVNPDPPINPIDTTDTLQGGYEEETIAEITSTPSIEVVYIGTLPPTVALDMPPVKSQGSQGSCSGWAVTYYLMSYLKHEAEGTNYYVGGVANNSVLCSPAYTFNQLKVGDGDCYGSSPVGHLLLLKQEGVCTLSEMPYNDNDCSTQPNAAQTLYAANNKISQYFKVDRDNIQLLKILLSLGKPLVFSIKSNDELHQLNTPYIWTPGTTGNGHSVTLSGYSDTYGGFQVTNSWGRYWGDNGKFYITYTDFQNLPNGKFCFTAFWKSNPALNNLTNGITSDFELNNDAVDAQSGDGFLVSTSGTTDRDGLPNNAVQLNGTSSYIGIDEDLNNTEFSLSFWFRSDNASMSDKVLFSQKDESVDPNLGLEILLEHDTLKLDMPIGTGRVRIGMDTIIQQNSWYHLVVTYDDSFVKLYVNGNTVVIGVCNNFFNSTTLATLGCRYKNSLGNKSNFFQGKIDDVKIYNRAINDAEVDELFQN